MVKKIAFFIGQIIGVLYIRAIRYLYLLLGYFFGVIGFSFWRVLVVILLSLIIFVCLQNWEKRKKDKR